MKDEEKSTDNSEDYDSQTGTTMPDCCGPILERMFKAFGETAEGTSNGESARDSAADQFRSCASMMKRMSSTCCGPASRGEEAKE